MRIHTLTFLEKTHLKLSSQAVVSNNSFNTMHSSISIFYIWLGFAIFNVDKEKEHEIFFIVKDQYLAPMTTSKIASEANLYKDY